MSRTGTRKRKARHLSPGKKLLLIAALLVVFALCSTLFLNLAAMDAAEKPAADGADWVDPIQAYVMAEGGTLTVPFYNDGFAVIGQYGRDHFQQFRLIVYKQELFAVPIRIVHNRPSLRFVVFIISYEF